MLDSDIIIWCLRGRKDVVEIIRELEKEAVPSCSALSIIEIKLGAKKKEEEATNAFLDALQVFPVDKNIAILAAKYIKEYKTKGKTLDFVDAVIAATAVINDLSLVTYNTKHYPIAELRLYPV